jgi:hypothetical protein
VISDQEHSLKVKERPEVSISKRCFGVGDFREFMECFGTSERIKGITLVNEVSGKINQVSEVFTFLLVVSLIVFISLSIILI